MSCDGGRPPALDYRRPHADSRRGDADARPDRAITMFTLVDVALGVVVWLIARHVTAIPDQLRPVASSEGKTDDAVA